MPRASNLEEEAQSKDDGCVYKEENRLPSWKRVELVACFNIILKKDVSWWVLEILYDYSKEWGLGKTNFHDVLDRYY